MWMRRPWCHMMLWASVVWCGTACVPCIFQGLSVVKVWFNGRSRSDHAIKVNEVEVAFDEIMCFCGREIVTSYLLPLLYPRTRADARRACPCPFPASCTLLSLCILVFLDCVSGYLVVDNGRDGLDGSNKVFFSSSVMLSDPDFSRHPR